MTQPRFSIGIDLGTTNSALAFVRLSGDGKSEVLPISQWESVSSIADASTLPSFLYLPEDTLAAQLGAAAGTRNSWVVGILARRKAGETPGRVARSAKSWLCHHAADRSSPFLPWGSEEITHESRISPIDASALILGALRDAWNARFAAEGPGFAFDAQAITVTVPASFDAVAQRLTLAAAQQAGFPETVRLLEEPQAAFYCWLERHDPLRDLWHQIVHPEPALHVLVIDIGGGTSDFSLFRLQRGDAGSLPAIERLAVSDHILLGGDNVDLAIAHLVERRLGNSEGKLSGSQWDHLVARCRDLKETALAGDGPPEQSFNVAIPGRGSGLVAGALSAQIARAEIESVLLDGFFPPCEAGDRPRKAYGALKEWGLPYASDTAIPRHLADFLRDRPPVDAVLFNGGSLHPPALRSRLIAQIGRWQGDRRPLALDNPQPELAVARGAARYGAILQQRARVIASGAARALFLAAHRKPASEDNTDHAPALVCILPQGAAPEQTFEVADRGLELRINRPVRFQTYYSGRHGRAQAGDIVDWNSQDFHPLPPLETVARVADAVRVRADRVVPVTLSAKLNDLGLLRVACRSNAADLQQTWPLEFDLRPYSGDSNDGGAAVPGTALVAEPNTTADTLAAARSRLTSLFTQSAGKRDKITAARVLGALESVIAMPKGDWNWVLVRSLWPTLYACMSSRAASVEHEEAWLILAGYLLRPGFGAPLDDARIDELWQLRVIGLRFPGKRAELQEHILWRRLAGGLDRQRQESVLASGIDRLQQQKASPELVRLAGALERISVAAKIELIALFIRAAAALAGERKHCAPYLAALGLLLNRTPLYAGHETVVPPEHVQHAYEVFARLDWAEPELAELPVLFLRAARVIGDRNLDVADGLRGRIARKLEKSGIPAQRLAKLRTFVPVERSERLGLYGEALPPGLLLSS